MTTLTRTQAVQLATRALSLDHPVRWTFRTNPLRLVSPLLQSSNRWLAFRVTIFSESRWMPLVVLEGPHLQGTFRVLWPFGRLARFLRERLRDWYEHEEAQRLQLVATLERLQGRKRLR